MFTTNIAARGLDFPQIDWVIQVDCPEDVPTYVHRVGRTARYTAEGKALLLLMPSENKFVDKLSAKGLEMKRIFPNPHKSMTIKSSLQSLVSEDMNLKHLAQKSFITYIRSVYLNKDKDVFDVKKINYEEFADSLGLIQTPTIQFVKTSDLPEAEENVPEEEKKEKN
jgi:ATP-dependent RNA helicase DDX10/DBP4